MHTEYDGWIVFLKCNLIKILVVIFEMYGDDRTRDMRDKSAEED